MARSTKQGSEKPRTGVGERVIGTASPSTKQLRIPAAYLATHRCKVCDGNLCTGHCKF
jgi:hypothetical protein